MSKPNSRATLKEWCLRKLGKPVIQINVSDDQVDDRIDEAFARFLDFHVDSFTKEFHKHAITSNDITNGYITIPETIFSVIRMFPVSSRTGSPFFNAEYDMIRNYFDMMGSVGGNYGGSGLVLYHSTKMHLELINDLLGSRPGYQYNRHTNRIVVPVDWSQFFSEGDFLVFEVYKELDSAAYSSVYNNPWLLKYATALIKKQWGSNLSKYDSVALPGGVTMRGGEIFNEAENEIQKLEDEVELKFMEPPDPFIA